jgi:GNAT superfamily N-acetyltransferase
MVEAARPATDADIPVLAELAEVAVAELQPMRGGDVFIATRSGRPVAEDLAVATKDPDQLVLAGTLDDAIVGYARARVDMLPDGRRLGVVDDLFVLDGARGVGLGETLMDTILAWCRERGCRGVDAVALPGHRATKNFFEESGFTARLIVMHRRLDRQDGE